MIKRVEDGRIDGNDVLHQLEAQSPDWLSVEIDRMVIVIWVQYADTDTDIQAVLGNLLYRVFINEEKQARCIVFFHADCLLEYVPFRLRARKQG